MMADALFVNAAAFFTVNPPHTAPKSRYDSAVTIRLVLEPLYVELDGVDRRSEAGSSS